MDFLKALDKAKELGLSKDEFLPIYMQEIKKKTEKPWQNLGLESYQSNDGASSVCSSASQFQRDSQEWRLRHQEIWQQPEQTSKTVLDELKEFLDNMKLSLYSQFQDFKSENTLDSEHLKSIQQDMNNQLTQIHRDIQASLPPSHNGDSENSDKICEAGGSKKADKKYEADYEIFNGVLEKLDAHILGMKQNIEHSQAEVVRELYCMQSSQKGDYHRQVNRQEELFMLQRAHINEHFNQELLAMQQWQTEQFSSLNEVKSLVVGNLSKVCELQNNFSAEMHQQRKTQQLLVANAANVCTTVAENSDLLKKFNGSREEIQRQNQGQHFNIPDILSQGQSVIGNRVGARKNDLCCDPHDDLENVARYTGLANEDPDTVSDNRIISVFESSAPCSGSIISVIYDFCIQNVPHFLESKNEFQKVTYDEKLGCCLRASVYFSKDKEPEDMLNICLDICQVGRDVILPDLLRILSEITLINRGSVVSFWNVAKEKGVFCLPKIKENGWFEVCAAFLDLQSSQFKDFVQNGTLSFYYNITVLNREANNKQEPHSDPFCGLTDLSCDNEDGERSRDNEDGERSRDNEDGERSRDKEDGERSRDNEDGERSHDNEDGERSHDSDNSEYFDADAEENEESACRISLDSFYAFLLNKSVPQPAVGYEATVQLPYSTYFLPVCGLNALVGSESVVDSQDWYLHCLGHSVHAVLAFLDDDTMMICIDYFHGACLSDLPEVAVYRCCVSLLDQTDQMEDLVIGDAVQVFDLTEETPADWMENCVSIIRCRTIENRFKNNGRIVLQFDFFDMA